MAIVTGPMDYLAQDWNLKDNEEWRLSSNPTIKTFFLDEILDLQGATKFDEKIKWYEAVAKKRVDQLNEALDNSETAIDVDDGTQFYLYSLIQVDNEVMYVTGISSNTLTVTRGFAGSSAASHDDDSLVYIYPQALPEYVTAFTETHRSSDAAPTSLENFGQCFFLDLDYDELLGSVYANNRQKGIYTPAMQMEEKLRDMKARMELQAILGRPYQSTVKTVPSMMGGLKYYIEQAGQNVVSDSTDLKRTSFNKALKALDRAGGSADWALMNSDDWEIMSEGWGEQRMIGRTETTVGHKVDTLLTAYGDIKIRYMHDLPRNIILFGNSRNIKMGNCNGLAFGRYETRPDAMSTVNRVQYRGWYTMQVNDIARSFCKLTWTGTVDADGV